jgi:hypothetical protein
LRHNQIALNFFSDDGFLRWSWFFEYMASNVKRSKEEEVVDFTAITAAMDTRGISHSNTAVAAIKASTPSWNGPPQSYRLVRINR